MGKLIRDSIIIVMAFTAINYVGNTLIFPSNADTKFRLEPYDPEYSPIDDLGKFEDSEYTPKLLMAKNPNHMQALKNDIIKEQENKERLLSSSSFETFLALLIANIIDPVKILASIILAYYMCRNFKPSRQTYGFLFMATLSSAIFFTALNSLGHIKEDYFLAMYLAKFCAISIWVYLSYALFLVKEKSEGKTD